MERIAVVGMGARFMTLFAKRLKNTYGDRVSIVGVCDTNRVRCEYYRDTVNPDVLIYDDFDKMLDEQKPDSVIVATPDCTHHEYIVKALEKGYPVYSEKPMTTTEEACLAIREAEKKSGKKVTVTFNCRFMPYYAKIKELLSSGAVGRVLSVHYEYQLDTKHGGDYFKRWHRSIETSGGMLVHKSTHHFDIVNWLLDDEPERVSAQGRRLYYGNDDRPHGERCSNCPHAETCYSYEAHHEKPGAQNMYFKAEHLDGYIRDHCVFLPDTNIYDTMSVTVGYKKGALLTYTLDMYSPREGYNLTVYGTEGRLEASTFFDNKDTYKIILTPHRGEVQEIVFPAAAGTHAGGDDRMLAMFFGDVTDDPLGQCSDSFDGVKSVLIGIAANRSIKEGVTVNLTPILDQMR